MLLLYCLFFGLTLANQEKHDIITKFDVPHAVRVGENVTLQCQFQQEGNTFDSLKISFYDAKGNVRTLYQRLHPSSVSHSDIVSQTDVDTIEISDIQPYFTGRYECVVDIGKEERVRKPLVVYTPGSGPMLNTTKVVNNSSEEMVLVTCEVQDVTPEPEVVIYREGVKLPSNETVREETDDGTWSVESAALTTQVMTGDRITCELYYKDVSFAHEPFETELTYNEGGVLPISTEESNTEVVPTPPDDASAQLNGNPVVVCAWLVMLAVAAQVLLPQ